MILLPYSRPWDAQPQEAVGPAIELGQDALLWSAVNPTLLLGAAAPAGSDASGSRSIGAPGIGRAWTRTANAGSLFGTFQHVSGLEITVAVVAAPVASSNRKVAFSQRTSASNAAQWYVGFNSDAGAGASSGSMSIIARSTAGTFPSSLAVGSQFDGGAHAWVCALGVGGGYVYRDGALQGTTGAAVSGTIWTSAQVTRIGNIGDYATDGAFVCDDPIYLVIVWPRVLPSEVARLLSSELAKNLGSAFHPQNIWVPVSAGGGAITIDGNLGNATAAGTAGQVGVAITVDASTGNATAAGTAGQVGVAITVDASTGNATAAGTTAQVGVSIDITGSVGNAAAAGVTGLPGVSLDIAATTGNAVAAGITGVVDLGGSITIDGNVGAAVAAGVQGLPGVAVTIDGAAGGAVAAGVSGSVSVTNDITINATAGNAVAAGILAGLSLDIEVAGVIGNATAAGTTGTVSLSGSGTGATAAEIWSYTLSSGLTAEATVVAIHTMLSELHLIHGLTVGSPLSVTVASRAAGAVSQAVAEAAGTVTVTRQ